MQTVKAADIRKKKTTWWNGSPPNEHLLWLKPLALQPKDTQLVVVWTNWDDVSVSAVLISAVLHWFHVFKLQCTSQCQLKHSQFLQEVAVEMHPCRKPVCPVSSFCLRCSFSQCPFSKWQPLPSMYSYQPVTLGTLPSQECFILCVFKGLLNCLM